MRKLFKGFMTSISMFSILPVPAAWDEDTFCWVIPAFPLVGLIIGVLWYGFFSLILQSAAPSELCSVAILLFPLFMSGFIHIDGYMDTCDAIFSRASLSKKREILKDPHIGAFAAIGLGVYLLFGYSSVRPVIKNVADTAAFVFIPVLSRCLAGITLLSVKPVFETGFGADFKRNARPVHKLIVVFLALLCVFAGYFTGGTRIAVPLAAMLAGGVFTALYAVKKLDGISGDLCGFIITISELCALLALAMEG